jgi:hypothetical protein
MYDEDLTREPAPGECHYTVAMYPSEQLRDRYHTSTPAIYTMFVGMIFGLMALTFFMFNRFIRLRNEKVLITAARYRAIVSSIIPSNIRDRILGENDIGQPKLAATSSLKDFLKGGEKKEEEEDDFMFKAKPIADLFPEVSRYLACLVCLVCLPVCICAFDWSHDVMYIAGIVDIVLTCCL